jgi:hypothetical protein
MTIEELARAYATDAILRKRAGSGVGKGPQTRDERPVLVRLAAKLGEVAFPWWVDGPHLRFIRAVTSMGCEWFDVDRTIFDACLGFGVDGRREYDLLTARVREAAKEVFQARISALARMGILLKLVANTIYGRDDPDNSYQLLLLWANVQFGSGIGVKPGIRNAAALAMAADPLLTPNDVRPCVENLEAGFDEAVIEYEQYQAPPYLDGPSPAWLPHSVPYDAYHFMPRHPGLDPKAVADVVKLVLLEQRKIDEVPGLKDFWIRGALPFYFPTTVMDIPLILKRLDVCLMEVCEEQGAGPEIYETLAFELRLRLGHDLHLPGLGIEGFAVVPRLLFNRASWPRLLDTLVRLFRNYDPSFNTVLEQVAIVQYLTGENPLKIDHAEEYSKKTAWKRRGVNKIMSLLQAKVDKIPLVIGRLDDFLDLHESVLSYHRREQPDSPGSGLIPPITPWVSKKVISAHGKEEPLSATPVHAD